MAQLDKSRLSKEMQEEVLDFNKTKEDAFFWLGNNKDVSIDQVINRIQASNICDVALSGIRTIDEWQNSNAPLKRVRPSLYPISNKNKFSSYALIEKNISYGKLRYPLCNSFASKQILFSNKTFPKYKELIKKLESAYKIKIIEKNDRDSLFSYKRKGKFQAKLKNIGLGVLNICRKIFKRNSFKIEPSYKGIIKINKSIAYSNGNVYIISEQEKFTKILDTILNLTVNSVAKRQKAKLDSEALFYSRLYAEVLLSRAINYGDKESNRKVESSLTLQMSNVLAGLNLTNQQLNQASKIGLYAALNAINKLGLTLEDVKQSIITAGYEYESQPQTIEEALFPKCKIQEIDNSNLELNAISTQFKEDKQELNDNDVIYLSYDKQKDIKLPAIINNNIQSNANSKITTQKELRGVKYDVAYINKITAKKYIDKVILKNFKNQIDTAIKGIYDDNVKDLKTKRLNRQYNFVEHMYTFYDKNKEEDIDKLNDLVKQELIDSACDNNYAHSFGKAFIELRQDIINNIFGDYDKIEKVYGRDVATVINNYVEEKYDRKLSAFVLEKLKKDLKPLFKEIDSKTYTEKSFIEKTKN